MQKKRTQKLPIDKVKEIITQDVPRIFLVGALVFTTVGLVTINQGKQTRLDSPNTSSTLQDLFRSKPGVRAPAASEAPSAGTLGERRTSPGQPPAATPNVGSESNSAEKNPTCPHATSPATPLPTDRAHTDTTHACTGDLPGSASPQVPTQPSL